MTSTVLLRITLVACCLVIANGAAAQDPHAEHKQPPKPATKPETAKSQPAKPQTAKPQPAKPQPPAATPQPKSGNPAVKEAGAVEDHSAHRGQGADAPKEPIPPLTDADRAAAFPPALEGHAVHDRRITAFVLFDRLEWQGRGAGGTHIENTTWIGGDLNRLWLRAEAESENGDAENITVDALYGRSVSRWWDVVAGVRQDFRPGPAQTWAAFGIQGLAPYWFEVEATGYVGADGRTSARFEAEYDLLFTSRFVAQPLLEMVFYGRPDIARGVGAGLSSTGFGARFRYEIRRELAPYIGVTWDRKFGETRDLASAAGEDASSGRVVFGMRAWF